MTIIRHSITFGLVTGLLRGNKERQGGIHLLGARAIGTRQSLRI